MKFFYEEQDEKCPDVTSPDDMEIGVGDEKYDNTERLDEEIETKCPDVTPPIDMEEGVGD